MILFLLGVTIPMKELKRIIMAVRPFFMLKILAVEFVSRIACWSIDLISHISIIMNNTALSDNEYRWARGHFNV